MNSVVMSSSVFYVCWIIAIVEGARYVDQRLLSSQSKSVKRTYLDCADSTKVEPELILQMKKGNWMEDETFKQWVLCVLVKNNHMTKQGVLQQEVVLNGVALHEKDKLENIIDKCLPAKRYIPREIAYRFAKCYRNHATNHSLF